MVLLRTLPLFDFYHDRDDKLCILSFISIVPID